MSKLSKTPYSWKKIINDFEKSNLAKAEFCKHNNIPISKFYYWCNKLRPDLKCDIPNQNSKNNFLSVKTTSKKMFSITLNSGASLHFDSMPDTRWLAKLLQSIGEMHDQH